MTAKADVIDAITARAGMYETLASLYFDRLTDEQIEAMASQDYTALMDNENTLIANGFNDIYRYLRKRNTGTRQELAVDFSTAFLGTHAYKGFVAQPYESLFLDRSGTLNAAPRKEIFNLYKSECVALREGYDYPDDHLAFECEFMSILCHRCATALEKDDIAEALRLLSVQRAFLTDHICRWFTRLHDLSLKFIKTRFYRGVLNITQGFFDEEVDSVDALRAAIEEGLEDESADSTECDAVCAERVSENQEAAEGGSLDGELEASGCDGGTDD